jgi:phenylpyruvate tautomerase PptA (4-oxalocrotonate tautomerase family)
MPYLKIQTNLRVAEAKTTSLLARATQVLVKQLGKPIQYVMVACQSDVPMLLGSSNDGLAFLELKSIGLPASKTKSLSQALCALIQEELGVRQERVYIEFVNVAGNMWGWNGDTF